MSTQTSPPPPPPETSPTPSSADRTRPSTSHLAVWGLALRLARRQVRRHPWRHALVTLMIMVPVLAAIAAFTLQRTWEVGETADRRYNSNDAVATVNMTLADPIPEKLTAHPPASLSADAVTQISRRVSEDSDGTATVEASLEGADWLATQEQQPDGAGPRLVGTRVSEAPEGSRWARRWVVESGHLPRNPDEIFLTRPLADNGRWHIGDTVTSGWSGRTFEVSGIGLAGDHTDEIAAVVAIMPADYWLAAPVGGEVMISRDPLPSGELPPDGATRVDSRTARPDLRIRVWAPPEHHEAVTDALTFLTGDPNSGSFNPEDMNAAFTRDFPGWDLGYVQRPELNSVNAATTIVGMGITVLMAGFAAVVAVVSSAAFAIASRRQLRDVGLLACAGADPRIVRRALVAQGAIPGLIAGGLAVATAVAVTTVLNRTGVVQDLSHQFGLELTIPVGGVLVAVTLGVVAGIVAAWQPARTASRVPVLSALAGRRPLGPVPTRVPLVGVAITGTGALLLAFITRLVTHGMGGSPFISILVLVAVLATVLGGIAVAPTLVAMTGRLANRTGGLVRLGLRGIARHRTQASATVGALAVCLSIPVGVLTARSAVTSAEDRVVEASSTDLEPTSAPGTLPEADTTAPNATSVLSNPKGLAVQIQGELGSPDAQAVTDRVQNSVGPLSPITYYGLADGKGGWYVVATVDAAQANGLLAGWAAQAVTEGRAVALDGAPGTVNLGGGTTEGTNPDANPGSPPDTRSVTATPAPDGGPADLGFNLEVDYLVSTEVMARVAPDLPPLNLVLVRSKPATRADLSALEDPMDFNRGRVPTLAELETGRPGATDPGTSVTTPPVNTEGFGNAWAQVIDHDVVIDYGIGSDGSKDRSDEEQRWLLGLAGVTGLLAVGVLTVTLSLRAVDSAEDHRAALAAGAPPARMRRQSAFEGTVLALLGALLALPLGWLPVTSVLAGARGDESFARGYPDWLVLPGWELIPMLLLPAVAIGIGWSVVPAVAAALRRGPRDLLLPRS